MKAKISLNFQKLKKVNFDIFLKITKPFDTHRALSTVSLYQLVGADKLLDDLFGSNTLACQDIQESQGRQEFSSVISMAKTMSCLSVDVKHCHISDLYSLANADSNEITQRFNLQEDDASPLSSSNSTSSPTNPLDSISGPNLGEKMNALCDQTNEGGIIARKRLKSSSCSDVHIDIDSNMTGYMGSTRNYQSAENINHHTTPSSSRESLHQDASDPATSVRTSRDSSSYFEVLDSYLGPFRKTLRKCVDADSFLDKLRYIARSVEELNFNMSRLYGEDHQVCGFRSILLLFLSVCLLVFLTY